jgi:hypothetical protein
MVFQGDEPEYPPAQVKIMSDHHLQTTPAARRRYASFRSSRHGEGRAVRSRGRLHRWRASRAPGRNVPPHHRTVGHILPASWRFSRRARLRGVRGSEAWSCPWLRQTRQSRRRGQSPRGQSCQLSRVCASGGVGSAVPSRQESVSSGHQPDEMPPTRQQPRVPCPVTCPAHGVRLEDGDVKSRRATVASSPRPHSGHPPPRRAAKTGGQRRKHPRHTPQTRQHLFSRLHVRGFPAIRRSTHVIPTLYMYQRRHTRCYASAASYPTRGSDGQKIKPNEPKPM